MAISAQLLAVAIIGEIIVITISILLATAAIMRFFTSEKAIIWYYNRIKNVGDIITEQMYKNEDD